MRIAVIGGGFAGVAVGLELAARGAHVRIYEREAACLSRASRHNEGKIHLGYVYAQDQTMRTASLLARGALVFEGWLRRWLGDTVDAIPVSDSFIYGVHCDSLVSPGSFQNHLRACGEVIRKEAGERASYFGRDPLASPRRLSDQQMRLIFDQKQIAAAYQTQEIAIDPQALCTAMTDRVAAETRIELACRHDVIAVEKAGNRLRVSSRAAADPGIAGSSSEASQLVSEEFDHVVNAAWEGRLTLDSKMGMEPLGRWSFRMKYFLRLHETAAVPTVTFVLGPYGDTVRYRETAYLSWYPAGLRHWSFEREPPAWPSCLGAKDSNRVARAICDGLRALLPNLPPTERLVETSSVKGGVIYALGVRDIDDPQSNLHDRSVGVGVAHRGNYHSINSGKLSLIPLFAMMLADSILPQEAPRV